ncbi:hypothetical protein [Clostridium perfringens]|uniref:hypothetical protein n=1 Tax=Clostridium perfringens TaxID=1502 RepID=UPI00096A7768|nr:hypothetical protein [Clostridium perfringens]MDM0732968.1 hypothetical protein [Clostridium perfringens]MDU2168955.1 hypothetical protein [Clostridium perfringens]MDU6143971.1 hypothetical protein [Clostridium perfringens]HAT4166106.1 hypothetical protein [Clostridium perfringens]
MEFDIIALVADSLSSLDIPVFEGWYDEEIKKTHITFFEYLEAPEDFLDDEEVSITHNIQVDIWTTNSEEGLKLKNKVKKLLKDNGFLLEDSNDQFEEDVKIYHKAMRFNYSEELD